MNTSELKHNVKKNTLRIEVENNFLFILTEYLHSNNYVSLRKEI